MISFVIPAHNEAELIGRALSAMHESARMAGEPYEVIVADDASIDGTSAIAREHGARVVAVNFRQIASTRNAGARVAIGDQLFFVDADTMVTGRAVCAAVRALRGGAVGGGSAVRFDGPIFSLLAITSASPAVELQPSEAFVHLLTGTQALLSIALTGLLGFVLGNRFRR